VNQRELERVKGNIEGLNELRSSYEEQRGCAEGLNKTFNFETNQNTLSEIKRLLIHIEEEIVKEERNLYLLKSSSSN
jgi:septation ring formation regulator EzrA